MQNKICVFLAEYEKKEFSAQEEGSRTYSVTWVHTKLFKEYETTRKLKIRRRKKDASFVFFFVLFFFRCVKHVLGKLSYPCSEIVSKIQKRCLKFKKRLRKVLQGTFLDKSGASLHENFMSPYSLPWEWKMFPLEEYFLHWMNGKRGWNMN